MERMGQACINGGVGQPLGMAPMGRACPYWVVALRPAQGRSPGRHRRRRGPRIAGIAKPFHLVGRVGSHNDVGFMGVEALIHKGFLL